MKIFKYLTLTGTSLCLLAGGLWLAGYNKPLVRHKTIHTDNFGAVSVAYPLFGEHEQVLAFVDTKQFPAQKLADRIAHLGTEAVIVDSAIALKTFSTGMEQCLDAKRVTASINSLMTKISGPNNKRLIVTGIGDGALLPFLHAEDPMQSDATNLSLDFSAVLPDHVTLCPPFITTQNDQQHVLTSSPGLTGNWRSVWTDQPATETTILLRGISATNTWIAPYDTPFDDVLIGELQTLLGQTGRSAVPMPVVEVPAKSANETVTIFYSGDGGWRDLDRIVAEEMAQQGYPVVGVDTLRGFWSRKTPEQATEELAKTLDYYRKAWGAKAFVLAGYSFGADILPAIYNRLTQADQDSVRLLVLLAFSSQADFEIHVSGWLGTNSSELPPAPEFSRLPKSKILCVYGQEEVTETACTAFADSQAEILELPGGHHFDEDYQNLTRLILEKYHRVGIDGPR